MKALSIRQPYASQIASGKKRHEYRSRRTTYRGPLLVCSSKAPDPGGEGLPCGVTVCTVEVVDCIQDPRGGLGWAWVLKNPKHVEPRPIKGVLGFYDVPDTEVVPSSPPTPPKRKRVPS